MFSADLFFKKLIESGWQGVVTETGLGVPFLDGLLRFSEGGASKVLKFGDCPYSREFQLPHIKDRSVSRAMAVGLARAGLDRMEDGLGLSTTPRFSVAVTGAYKRPEEHGDTHAWVAVARDDGEAVRVVTAGHYWIQKGPGRSDAIDMSGAATAFFLSKVIFSAFPQVASISAQFDVLEGLPMEEMLAHCTGSNPLVHVPGTGFVRAKDWIRNPGLRVFRGSFNPPHRVHEEMGRGALWAIDFENARKGKITVEDMAHRIRMAGILGVPVLVTHGLPRFVDFHNALTGWGASGQVRYVVGPDTLEAIVDPKHCDGSPEVYLQEMSEGRAMFEVFVDDGDTEMDRAVTRAARKGGLWVNMKYGKNLSRVRSTEARAGARTDLHPDVAEYVADVNLYGKK